MLLELGIGGITIALISVLFARRNKKILPPGPRGLPLIGNLFDLPKKLYWEKYHEWSVKYKSDVIYLNILGSPIIVIDSYKVAQALIEQNSSIYSSRPHMPMLVDLTGFSWHVAFMPYGKKWKERRKVLHKFFETSAQRDYRPRSLRATRILLHNILETPNDFTKHVRFLSGSIILAISYGTIVKSSDDPHIMRAERGMHAMAQAGYGYIVDFFPSIRYLPSWFPGGYFKAQAAEWRKHVEDMANVPFASVKKLVADGAAPESIATKLLSDIITDRSHDQSHDEAVVKDALASAYAAGSDSTVSAILTFFLAMVLYPEVQKKGQEAVDKILLGQRLPDFSDFKSIPYVGAIEREVTRWKPVVPLGIPYSVLEDDMYNGYHFPAGTTVYVNAWAMLQDEDVYGHDPTVFRPERFLGIDGRLDRNVRVPTEAFGFGRRFCPGMTTARESIWIAIASVLATFNIEKASTADGTPIEPSAEYSSAFLSHPLPFPCRITPRSTEAISLIRADLFEAAFNEL